MALLNWRAEVRRRLAPFEKQFRHQRNRERHYQALQEERERKRDASTERRRATWERRMWEKVEKSEKDALKDRKMVPQQETVLDFLEELCDPSELPEEEEDSDRQTAGLSGFFQRRAPAPQKSRKAQEKSLEKEMDDSTAERQSGNITQPTAPEPQSGNITQPSPPKPQVLLPQRPKMDAPKSANDRGSTGTPQSGSMSKPAPARPRVVLSNKPRSGMERVYGLKSADAYKQTTLPWTGHLTSEPGCCGLLR
ncbi:hypothetical protein GJAV_G00269460 [Gymnothorax javanicus]|nr:hypothetical protein GJAV_G00269460 [Gymnothorax javanicus]